MTKTRIGVVRGGPSDEYEISLGTGSAVINALDKEKYEPLDIVISKDGFWYIHGLEVKPDEAFKKTDVIFNALHGYYGEDGKIQQLMETHNIPFTGSGSLSSAMAMAKHLAKNIFLQSGLKVPAHIIVERKEGKEIDTTEAYIGAHSKFPLPYIVKPVYSGSSIGVVLVKNRESFNDALDKALEISNKVIVEEFIGGVEVSVAVIESFRGKELYTLPPIEIRHSGKDFFDHDAKYSGYSHEIVPSTFSTSIKNELERLAMSAHQSLGLSQYSRSDFIVSPRRGIFILETNSLPGLTDESLLPKALKSVGSSLSDFTDHLIRLALKE